MYTHQYAAEHVAHDRTLQRLAEADRHRLVRRRRSQPSLGSTAPRTATLAERLADVGPTAVEAELATYARFARRAGADRILVDALTDVAEAPVARQRAFGRIATWLADDGRTDCCGGDAVAA